MFSSIRNFGSKLSGALSAPKTRSFTLESMDSSLDQIARHAKAYPPQFSTPSERKRIEHQLKEALALLLAASESDTKNPDLLLRSAVANGMGHNLDIPGCAQRALDSYERLLALNPDDGRVNYLFGGFLAATATLQARAVPLLEKAIALGITDAHYTLGLLYTFFENKEASLLHFRAYMQYNPSDMVAEKMILAIENGNVERE